MSNTTEKPVKQYRPLVYICSPYSGNTKTKYESYVELVGCKRV